MPLFNKDKQIIERDWQRVDDSEALAAADADVRLLMPFALYVETQDSLSGRDVIVEIDGDGDFDTLLEMRDRFRAIAIGFPVFRDGRGFSFAHILRREGYQGDLIATGNFARDQLGYLARCGFNLFDADDAVFNDHWLAAFDEITVSYQGAADDPRPLFARG